MTKKECGNGHIYDADIHSSCPYCRDQKGTIIFPLPPQKDSGEGATIPAERPLRPVADPAPTVPVGETVSVIQEICGYDPVAGWLVGVDKGMIGRACELKARANRIGRSEEMDVRIESDRTVSVTDHAYIDYDRMTDTFTLIPGHFVNTIYLNGKAVYTAESLKAYDRILLGRTEMMFIPFCGQSFRWPTEEADTAEARSGGESAPDEAPLGEDKAEPAQPPVDLKKPMTGGTPNDP